MAHFEQIVFKVQIKFTIRSEFKVESWKMAKESRLKTYFRATTLHGFAYLANKRNSLAEKIFWIFVLIVSIGCNIILVMKLFERIESNPTIMYRSNVATQVTDISFPALTYCSSTLRNSSRRNTALFMTAWKLITDNDTPEDVHTIQPENTKKIFKLIEGNVYSHLKFRGSWLNSFKLLIRTSLMSCGICQTINLADINDVINSSNPWKTNNYDSGIQGLIFKENKTRTGNGFIIFIHNPYELPYEGHQQMILNEKEKVTFLVEPRLKILDESLMNLPIEKRNCYRNDEKKLVMFKVYTKHNCQHECLWFYIRDQCNCIPFYMLLSPSTTICSVDKKKCYKEAHKTFWELSPKFCNCLDLCENLEYIIEKRKSLFIKDLIEKHMEKQMEDTPKSFISIRFKNEEFYPLVTSSFMSSIDIISYIGGYLGLFLGFSFLSLMEIIYYVFIKTTSDKSCRKSGKPNGNEEDSSNLFSAFIKESSIHGLVYMNDRKLSFTERFIWIACFVISMTLCMFMISKLYVQLGTQGVMTVMDNPMSVSEIPFPAVTFFTQHPRSDKKKPVGKILNIILSDDFNDTHARHAHKIFKRLRVSSRTELKMNRQMMIKQPKVTFYEAL
ncbi:CLUMA_CG020714, isoform A [Clunio marinus]|uniref:CLUMA_CG020714, isoform A n=1 Tax=Clunio marinus TaxID=568069 RepID=A0A1J1J5T4_9DIPT|nr:CLUMA_CG020714, isoform A [Clunio marinus]